MHPPYPRAAVELLGVYFGLRKGRVWPYLCGGRNLNRCSSTLFVLLLAVFNISVDELLICKTGQSL